LIGLIGIRGKLERQELRQRNFDGWFISVAEAEAVKEEWSNSVSSRKQLHEEDERCPIISELLIVLMKNRMY